MPSRMGFFREVYRMIQQGLCARGMRKHTKGRYSRHITSDAVGVVGLNAATKYRFEINPIIGVQHLPLEHLLAELKERRFHPAESGATIAFPIGYLGPGQMFWTWKFEEGRDNAATVAEMVDEITTIGFRYMEDNCTLEKVCERLAVDRHFIMGNDVCQLPVGYMMLGRFHEAEKVVRDHLHKIETEKGPSLEELATKYGELDPPVRARLEKYEQEPIPYVVNYRRFAERFFRRLDEERNQSSTQ